MTDLDRYKTLVGRSVMLGITNSEHDEMVLLYKKLKKAEDNQKHFDYMGSLGRCITCHSKQHNYTKIGGCKKTDCCDYNVHFNDCSHGDCSCECHILQQNQKTPDDVEKINRGDTCKIQNHDQIIIEYNARFQSVVKCVEQEKEISELKQKLAKYEDKE